jgi:hypothetical protein
VGAEVASWPRKELTQREQRKSTESAEGLGLLTKRNPGCSVIRRKNPTPPSHIESGASGDGGTQDPGSTKRNPGHPAEVASRPRKELTEGAEGRAQRARRVWGLALARKIFVGLLQGIAGCYAVEHDGSFFIKACGAGCSRIMPDKLWLLDRIHGRRVGR